MHRRISLLIAAVAVLCLAVAVPTASAGPKTDRAQNKKLKSQSKAIKKNSAGVRKGSRDVTALKNSAKAVSGAIDALKIVAARADKNGADFAAAAPAVIKGLSDLRDGLVAAGAGLTSLRTLATSQEYGFGQVTVGALPGTAQAGSFMVTPDIPDTVQQAQSTQQFVAQTAGNVNVLYGVRSNETDGTGAGNPAAACKVTVTNEGGTTETTAPNATLGGVPFQFVPTKSVLTSTVPANAGFPFGLKTAAPDADVFEAFGSTVAVAIGETYTVGMSCVDTSPSPTDPAA